MIAACILDAEGSLYALRGVVGKVDVKIEVPFLVAIAKFEDVAGPPWVIRIRKIPNVDWLRAIVARVCREGQEPVPAGLRDCPIENVAGTGCEITVVNPVFLPQRLLVSS